MAWELLIVDAMKALLAGLVVWIGMSSAVAAVAGAEDVLNCLSELAAFSPDSGARLSQSTSPLLASIPDAIVSLLRHPLVTLKKRLGIVLISPEDEVANGARYYELIPGTFSFSSHGTPGRAVVYPYTRAPQRAVYLSPVEVASILAQSPKFAQIKFLFVNSCWSATSPPRGGRRMRSLAEELARITGRSTFGWNGEVHSENRNGTNVMWVADEAGATVPYDRMLVVFTPMGERRVLSDPQRLFPHVSLLGPGGPNGE